MRYLLFLIFIFYLSLGAMASDEASGFRFERDRSSVSIPIEVHNNLAVVTIHINNRGPFYFILDTGVRTTILTEPMLAHLLDIEFDDHIFIYGLGGDGYVLAALASGVHMSMHGIIGDNMNLIVIPEDILKFSEVFGFPVYGILGYDFFKQFPVEIDYSNERMRVYRDNSYRTGRRSYEIPIMVANGKPYVNTMVVGENGDTLTTTLLLDLGASHPIYLNRRYIGLSDRTMRSFIGKGISGNLLGEVGRVQEFFIGDIKIDEPLVFYPDTEFLVFYDEEINWQGLIGGAILSRFNIILDYEREKLVLRPSRNFSNPFQTNMSGLEVIATGPEFNKYNVHYVRPGSVAYEAGILAGDQIIQINHLRPHELEMNEIINILTSREGVRISMMIRRDDKVLRKQFRLREDL